MVKRRLNLEKLLIIAGILIIALSCIFSGPICTSISYGRVSGISYRVNVNEKEGEKLSDVTLYLPFPHEGDKLMPALLGDVDGFANEIYSKSDDPRISVTPVKTRYGVMLKVHISKMLPETHGVSLDGSFGYAKPIPTGNIYNEYPLVPIFSPKQKIEPFMINQKDMVIKKEVPVYVDYKGGNGLFLHVDYAATYYDQYFPHIVGGHGRQWIISKGLTNYDALTDAKKDRIEVNKKGWVMLPVWIQYESGEKTP